MRRLRYKPKTHSNSTFGLNINSMTDMFTIMLVFLLQTYSTNPVEVKPTNGIRMPSSVSPVGPVESIQISIGADGLIFDGKIIAHLQKNEFESSTWDSTDPSFIKPFFEILNKIATEGKTVEAKEGRLLIQADRDLPYETIRKVLYTASMAGFPKVKLATVSGE